VGNGKGLGEKRDPRDLDRSERAGVVVRTGKQMEFFCSSPRPPHRRMVTGFRTCALACTAHRRARLRSHLLQLVFTPPPLKVTAPAVP